MTHAFEGRIVHLPGALSYAVVFLPERLVDELPFATQPRLRLRGKFGGVPFAAVWKPSGERWYFMVSQRLLRLSGYALGELALVSFQLESPDTVHTPEILTEALQKAGLTKHWNVLPPGLRRSYAYGIASARRTDTVQRRLTEVLEWVKTMAEDREPSLGKFRL